MLALAQLSKTNVRWSLEWFSVDFRCDIAKGPSVRFAHICQQFSEREMYESTAILDRDIGGLGGRGPGGE